MNVLFLYPNLNTELRIPLALSILIACTKRAGHTPTLFDPTFMVEKFCTDDEKMAALGTHLPTNLREAVGEIARVDILEELEKTIATRSINAVMVSLLERNFPTAKRLCLHIKAKYPSMPIIVGGIMPTIATEFLANETWIDMLCVGEGEEFAVDVLNALERGEEPDFIMNLCRRRDGRVMRNPLRGLINLNAVPDQDWQLFDRRHMLKPFMGKIYRGGPFEFSRGCNKKCSFCVAPQLRSAAKGLGHYHRTKTPATLLDEIEHKAGVYQLTMISFSDTDFLGAVPKKVMTEFLEGYYERIRLPFTMQCSAETLLDEEIVRLLVKAGCCAASVGVESGSDHVRKSIIKKFVPKDAIRKAFEICFNHRLRITGNYMVGVPYETEEDVIETIRFNRELKMPSIAVTFFTPFVGTELYDVSVKEGFYKPIDLGSNNYETAPLVMPQFSQEAIYRMVRELVEDFNSCHSDFVPPILEAA